MPREISIPHVFPPDSRPPTRISVQGHSYKLISPYFVRLPLAGSVKTIMNWVSTFGTFAKNITYLQGPSNYNTGQVSTLLSLANSVMSAFQGSNLAPNYGNQWSLASVTCKDNGTGSEAQATSTHAPIQGTNGTNTLPPNAAVVVSWSIAANYRGGKPRWYFPGVAVSGLTTPGGNVLTVAYATAVEAAATGIMTGLQGFIVDAVPWNLGTISYQTGHSPRPTPLFRLFTGAKVHQRLDTQRRRLGKESSYGSVPQ